MGPGGIKKHRTETPDQSEWTRLLGREKKALIGVAKTILRTVLRLHWRILRQVLNVKQIVLRNDREDCA